MPQQFQKRTSIPRATSQCHLLHRFCIAILAISSLVSSWFQTQVLVNEQRRRRRTIHGSEDGGGSLLQKSIQIRGPLVKRDEFLYRLASAAEVQDYFRFDEPSAYGLLNIARKALSPMWSCSSSHHHQEENRDSQKLVFVHISRSGGSTLSVLLKAFAKKCRASMAVVSHCYDLGWHSLVIPNEPWVNAAPQSPHYCSKCALTSLQERSGYQHEFKFSSNAPSVPISTQQTLERYSVDILAGHIPLGSAANWKQNNPTTLTSNSSSSKQERPSIRPRYVVFFRDPLSRYVSQFLMSSWTEGDSVSTILQKLDQHVRMRMQMQNKRQQPPFCSTLFNSLLTPEQRYWAERQGVSWTLERQVNISKANLIGDHLATVVVGILEHMSDSMHLLQHLLDGGGLGEMQQQKQGNADVGEFSHIFELLTSSDHNPLFQLRQKSRQRTQSVVQAVKSNSTLHALLWHYLRYEYDVYKFALKVHAAQANWLKRIKNSNSGSALLSHQEITT